MKPEQYWQKPLKSKPGTKGHLKGRRFHYDFEWTQVFPTSKEIWSNFPGLKTVGEIIASRIQGDDWSDVELILTTGSNSPMHHEVKDGKHFFVFDAEKLQDRKFSVTTAFLGKVASETPDIIDAYQILRESPNALKKGMLDADSIKLLAELKEGEAKSLLPMALGLLTEALGDLSEDKNEFDGTDKLFDNIDIKALVRSLRVILARAISRGNVSEVFAVLDTHGETQRNYFKRNPEIVKLVAEEDITSFEIVGIAYRKAQIEVFKNLLESSEYVEKYKTENNITKHGEEPAWQGFFEKNKWIFGLALDYFFNEPVSKDKLEVISRGSTFLQHGKRPDGLLASVGLIRSLCFVEIKTPRKPLLGGKYREEVWPPSKDLSSAVAQSQKTVYQSIRELHERFKITSDEGAEEGNPIYTVYPRSYIVIGDRREFFDSKGADKSKMIASFELYRRDLARPEVITFDELFERAKRLQIPIYQIQNVK